MGFKFVELGEDTQFIGMIYLCVEHPIDKFYVICVFIDI